MEVLEKNHFGSHLEQEWPTPLVADPPRCNSNTRLNLSVPKKMTSTFESKFVPDSLFYDKLCYILKFRLCISVKQLRKKGQTLKKNY